MRLSLKVGCHTCHTRSQFDNKCCQSGLYNGSRTSAECRQFPWDHRQVYHCNLARWNPHNLARCNPHNLARSSNRKEIVLRKLHSQQDNPGNRRKGERQTRRCFLRKDKMKQFRIQLGKSGQARQITFWCKGRSESISTWVHSTARLAWLNATCWRLSWWRNHDKFL